MNELQLIYWLLSTGVATSLLKFTTFSFALFKTVDALERTAVLS